LQTDEKQIFLTVKKKKKKLSPTPMSRQISSPTQIQTVPGFFGLDYSFFKILWVHPTDIIISAKHTDTHVLYNTQRCIWSTDIMHIVQVLV